MKKKNLVPGGKLDLNKKFITSLSVTQCSGIVAGGDTSVIVVKTTETNPKPQPQTQTQPNPKPTPIPAPQSLDGGRTCTVFGPGA